MFSFLAKARDQGSFHLRSLNFFRSLEASLFRMKVKIAPGGFYGPGLEMHIASTTFHDFISTLKEKLGSAIKLCDPRKKREIWVLVSKGFSYVNLSPQLP